MTPFEPEIIFQDEHFLAINKPAGLLVHPTRIDKHEKQSVLQVIQNKLQQKVYIIHRLDKPTSGILLLALHQEAAKKGIEAFASSEVMKVYLAIVRGFTEPSGEIQRALPPVPDKLLGSKQNTSRKSKPSLTLYRRLAQHELPVFISRHATSRYSLLEVHPQTGRMHQIRRHLKQINHPVIGDSKYGDHKHNRYFREELSCERLMLAATELSIFHPYRGAALRLTARIDTTFESIIKRFNWQDQLSAEWLPPQ